MQLGPILFSAQQISQQVQQLGQQIAADYPDGELLLVGVLKGAALFTADLARAIPRQVELGFVSAKSYSGSQTTGEVALQQEASLRLEGRHVLVVEDIIDTGITLKALTNSLLAHNPASLHVCCLLNKPARRRADYTPRYSGFMIDDEFVVGYGLDFDELYRNLPDIRIMVEDQE